MPSSPRAPPWRPRSRRSPGERKITRRGSRPSARSGSRASLGAEGAEQRPLERIGILGAGTMGAGIAQIAVEAGIEAVVHDPIVGTYERDQQRIAGFPARRGEKGQLDAAAAGAP